jgi:hypothetical protein
MYEMMKNWCVTSWYNKLNDIDGLEFPSTGTYAAQGKGAQKITNRNPEN